MNAAAIMQTCPDQETLAAFIDGRLDERTRQEIIQHLLECPECEDKVVAANEYLSSLEPAESGEVVRGRFRSRVLPALVAVAAGLAVVFWGPSLWERVRPKSDMEKLVATANGLPMRPTDARLSGDFVYKRPQSIFRGGVETTELDMEILALDHAEQAAKNPTSANLHESGVADLFVAKRRRQAVTPLERAATASPNSPTVLTDLTAAYLARGDKGDYERAYATATKAWSIQQTPITAWNRALALERLGSKAEAIAAWNKYLELDPNSEWSIEARKKIDDLQNF